MNDRIETPQHDDAPAVARTTWIVPEVRRIRASDAELGVIAPSGDGVTGLDS